MEKKEYTIEAKLRGFYRKFYINQLVKGSILFLVLGFIFVFCVLYLEYFLWLTPSSRVVLFWSFVAIELFLLFRFILLSLFKLTGIQSGISYEESSKIIGNHFPEVQDKLLNILQLKEHNDQTDLLVAGIDQKSKELRPIPFSNAVNFRKNRKYLVYILIPLLIWVISFFSGTHKGLSDSFSRVVNFNTEYLPPAPFSFQLVNTHLNVIQGKSITVNFNTVGSVVPLEAKIYFSNQDYFLDTNGQGNFSFTFSNLQESFTFYVSSQTIQSGEYKVHVIKVPVIRNIEMGFLYPKYIRKKNNTTQNITNIAVPEGTHLIWKIETTETEELTFITGSKKDTFTKVSDQEFRYKKQIKKPLHYQIVSSNNNLSEYEKLGFSIDVIKDQFPQITVAPVSDSISENQRFFAGQISDDYGLECLQMVFYKQSDPENKFIHDISIDKNTLQTFFYELPDNSMTDKGIAYELYFEVFDNDGVNGSKKTRSKTFFFRKKTTIEEEEELLEEQKDHIKIIEQSIRKRKEDQKELDAIEKKLKNQKGLNWNDKKTIDNYIKRQGNYREMMERLTDRMEKNLEEKPENNELLQDKKDALKKRIEELRKLEKQQKLLDELEQLAKKLNKEELINKVKELTQQNKQQEKSLERIVELTKRFYVEQKIMQIANKLDKLSIKQDTIQNKGPNANQQQKGISNDFKELERELEELSKENEKLKNPMAIPETGEEQEEIDKEINKASDNLAGKRNKAAKRSQKKAAKKMKEMSRKMQQSLLDMQSQMIDENIEDLRKILENVIVFSFEQENLMNTFGNISSDHPEFGKNLRKQNEIKTYFEHIDDSLYALSMRMPRISTKIQDDLSAAHYNLAQSLENFTERKFTKGLSNQRYVMTAANNLADFLSNLLNSMQNSISFPGKGKSGTSFSLPDLIQKQQGLSKKMEKGTKKGEKKGGEKPDKKGEKGKQKGRGNGDEQIHEELYQIYKEQSQLREQLQNALKEGGNKSEAAKALLKTMEALENEILEKGFNAATLRKMKKLEYQLLKLEKALAEQGFEKKRTSGANKNDATKKRIRELILKKEFYNQTEILNRQSLPLRQKYKEKVHTYFKKN